MRPLAWALTIAAMLAIALPGIAVARDATDVGAVAVARWLTDGDYAAGLILALFGLGGALFTAFTFVGGTVPGTAGGSPDCVGIDLYPGCIGSKIS